MCRTHGESGFTLLEALLTLSILAGVSALATLSFGGRIGALRTENAAQKIADVYRSAQVRALTSGREISVTYSFATSSFQTDTGAITDRIPDNVNIEIEVGRNLARVDQASIVFYPNGSSSGGRIFIDGQSRGYTIEIDWLTGFVSIQRENRNV